MKNIIIAAILLLIGSRLSMAESDHYFGPIGIDILKPVDGTSVPVESLEIIAKYYNFKHRYISNSQIKVYCDNREITWLCNIRENEITFTPDESFKSQFEIAGDHVFRIAIEDKRGSVLYQKKINIHVTRRERPNRSNTEKRGYLRFIGTKDDSLSGKCLLSFDFENGFIKNRNLILLSPEHALLGQPVTYINTMFEKDDIMRLTIGDFYPDYHELILYGVRVRGVQINTNSFLRGHRIFSFNMAYGLLRTGDENYGFTGKGVQDLGVYKRRAFSVNPTVGFNDYFNIGFILFKSIDDINSIELEYDSMNRLVNADTPKDNLAVGVNAYSYFLDNKIKVYGNWAAGIFTDDTRGGAFTEDQLASLGLPYSNGYYQYNEYLLIMNTTSSHLSLDFNDITKEITSYNYGASYDFRSNHINGVTDVRYVYNGPKFSSFGLNDATQSDQKGIVISEKIDVLKNKIEFNYEQAFLAKHLDPFWSGSNEISQSYFSIKYRAEDPDWYTDLAYYNHHENYHNALSGISTNINQIALRSTAPVDIGNTKNVINILCNYNEAAADERQLYDILYCIGFHSDFGHLPYSGYVSCSQFEDYLGNSDDKSEVDIGFDYEIPRYSSHILMRLKTMINNEDYGKHHILDCGLVTEVIKNLNTDIHLSFSNENTTYMSLTLDYNLDAE